MTTIALNFSVQDLNIIMQGLLELPAKTSIDLIGKIQRDVQSQIDAASTDDGASEDGVREAGSGKRESA